MLPLPPAHRFPMAKYRLLRERLVEDGTLDPARLSVPPPASDDELCTVHTARYVHSVVGGTLDAGAIRRLGFPWSPQLVERSRRSVGGTLAAARAALEIGVAVNLAGGTHHSFPDRGEGYCVFNDAAVAVRALQRDGRIAHALIVDCDVHQGNGTAAAFESEPTVATYSIHGRRNFPFHKRRSDVDVPLEDAAGDEEYLCALEDTLPPMLRAQRPDVVIYVSGADPWEGDRLGRLALSKRGLAERDRFVLGLCAAAAVPVAVVMAGGYAPDVGDIVDIHARTVAVALEYGRAPFAGGIMKAHDDSGPTSRGTP